MKAKNTFRGQRNGLSKLDKMDKIDNIDSSYISEEHYLEIMMTTSEVQRKAFFPSFSEHIVIVHNANGINELFNTIKCSFIEINDQSFTTIFKVDNIAKIVLPPLADVLFYNGNLFDDVLKTVGRFSGDAAAVTRYYKNLHESC